MKIHKKDIEIIKLSSREVLLSLFDMATPFFSASKIYHQSINKYLNQRSVDRTNFFNRIQYLKNQKYIEVFVEHKDKYLELTPKGIGHIQILSLDNLKINRPEKWDSKWRVVIFDVPEKLHHDRDLLRDKLKRLGFIQIQKSVYVYPFECAKEITILSETLKINKFVTVMVSEIIQGEEKIIEHFLHDKVLNNSDLKRQKNITFHTVV